MEILNDFSTSVRKALEEIDPQYEKYDGLVICGTHAPHDTEMMIGKIKEARETKRPALLICFGHQLCAIEFARNILGIKDATSEEFGQGTFVVKQRPVMKIGLHEGESWWSNYEVAIEFTTPPHFIAVPFHPEYGSSLLKSHPLLVSFIKLCKKI